MKYTEIYTGTNLECWGNYRYLKVSGMPKSNRLLSNVCAKHFVRKYFGLESATTQARTNPNVNPLNILQTERLS